MLRGQCLYLEITPNLGIEETVQCSENYTGLESKLTHVDEGDPYETALFVSKNS